MSNWRHPKILLTIDGGNVRLTLSLKLLIFKIESLRTLLVSSLCEKGLIKFPTALDGFLLKNK